MSLQMADIGDLGDMTEADEIDHDITNQDPGASSAEQGGNTLGAESVDFDKELLALDAPNSVSLRNKAIDTDQRNIIDLGVDRSQISTRDGMPDRSISKQSSGYFGSTLAGMGNGKSLGTLEMRFESLAMNELDLVSMPPSVLETRITDLETLKADLIEYGKAEGLTGPTNTEHRQKKYAELLLQIDLQLGLSQNLSLDVILNEDYDESIEEDVSFSTLPQNPPAGDKQVEVGSPLAWQDRFNISIRAGNFDQAVDMILALYIGAPNHVVAGLPNDESERQDVLRSHLSDLIMSYLKMATSAYHPGDIIPIDEQHRLQVLLAKILETAIIISRDDLIATEIFDACKDAGLQSYFMEALEPFVLQGRFGPIDSPSIVQSYLNYYKSQGWTQRIEQLILHMDPASIDVNEAVMLCREFKLYYGLIFIFNRILNDFITPLIDLLKLLESSDESAENRSIVFVYLAYIFTGRSLPDWQLGKRESLLAKTDIYNFLFSESHIKWPHSLFVNNEIRLGTAPFPYINLLIKYDCQELCQVLAIALEDPSLQGEIHVRGGHALDGKVRFADEHTELNRNFILEKLFFIATLYENEFELTTIYTLICKSYARYFKDATLSKPKMDILLEHLIDRAIDPKSLESRQAAVEELMPMLYQLSHHSEAEALAKRCENAAFWNVCEIIYRKMRKFDKVLNCYLADIRKKPDIFRCLHELLVTDILTYAEMCDLKNAIMSNITVLADSNPWEVAAMISSIFPGDMKDVVARLNINPTVSYKYLGALLQPFEKQPSSDKFFFNESISESGAAVQQLEWLQTMYILLMIDADPGKVIPYLQSLSDVQQTGLYDHEAILKHARTKNQHFLIIWLLEKAGEFELCMSTILDGIDAQTRLLLQSKASDVDGYSKVLDDLSKWIQTGIKFCRRQSKTDRISNFQQIWLKLFRAVLGHQSQITDLMMGTEADTTVHSLRQSGVDLFNDSVSDIAVNMMGYVPLQLIFDTLLTERQQVNTIANCGNTLLQVLREASFDIELFTVSARVSAKDTCRLIAQSLRKRQLGIRPEKGLCGLCQQKIQVPDQDSKPIPPSNELIIFQCRHVYHVECLLKQLTTSKWDGLPNSERWCFQCARLGINEAQCYKASSMSTLQSTVSTKLAPLQDDKNISGATTDTSKIEAIKFLNTLFNRFQTSAEILEIVNLPDGQIEDTIDMNEAMPSMSFGDEESSLSYPSIKQIPLPAQGALVALPERYKLKLEAPIFADPL
ncbi:Vacuolar protein sorting-associated protein 8 [Chytridiales sp. JEL 0842]|nr:Vacuolar protein sorting-associated protein 8 [Chytridiales sp. JEL 0842]